MQRLECETTTFLDRRVTGGDGLKGSLICDNTGNLSASAGRIGNVTPADSWADARAEAIHAIEPGVGGVLFFCDAGAAAIFDGMLAERHISDVLKFIAILHIVVQTRTVTSTEERA